MLFYFQVTIEDRDRLAVCASTNDPHIATFDDKYVIYINILNCINILIIKYTLISKIHIEI